MREILEQEELIAAEPAERIAPAPARRYELILLLVAAVIFLGCIISPPSLMDDVDAAHAQLARNMLTTGDWVIPQLDGVPYIEKAPLPYWMIAAAFRIFGINDWASRLPFALAAIFLCWITWRFGKWAFGARAGFYAGLSLATCIGLFLFTRILIPDVMITTCACLSFWCLLRSLDEEEAHPGRWAALLPVTMAVGVLLKGLIALVLPAGGALLYVAITRQLFRRETWRRLRVIRGALIFLIIAAPWHVLAARRMPPYLDFTMHSGPGQYHGFFWFYFMNEHVLRFLGLRYPHDYNTVPRAAFWLLNLLWLFPWSVYLPGALKLDYKPVDRAGRTRLLALCWIAFLMLFFTFSTTQEYYSMPIYPAVALLIGSVMEQDEKWLRRGGRIAGIIAALAAVAIGSILFAVRHVKAEGDISAALTQHPDAYTLSLGHMSDLTLSSFAYLRLPLAVAGLACLFGVAGGWLLPKRKGVFALAAMMVLFFHASRMALVVFDPYLSSRTLAEALQRAPEGELIVDGAYYPYSSILFYANRPALLLNGRITNLEYGSYAPGAPSVFIQDSDLARLWNQSELRYLIAERARLAELGSLMGSANIHILAESGGKVLVSNHSYPGSGTTSQVQSRYRLW